MQFHDNLASTREKLVFPDHTHLLFVAFEKQRHRPACASTQSDQRLRFSLTEE